MIPMNRKPAVSNNKKLMKEWNFEKNSEIGINPDIITLGSSRKAYWTCGVCGNVWLANIAQRNYGQGCNNRECVNDRRKKTVIRRYGENGFSRSKETTEKMRKTCLEKYGVENPFQSEEIKEKIKQTNLEKYGVTCALQNKKIKEKQTKTILKKYGVKSPLQNEDIKEKTRKTCLEKYGVENPSQAECVKEKKKQTSLMTNGKEHHWIKDECKKGNRAEYHKKYNGEFNDKLKNEIKERDGNQCQSPHCNKENKSLLVHHIDNIKHNNHPKNLITLCFSCHSKVTMSRGRKVKYYISLFHLIVTEKYT